MSYDLAVWVGPPPVSSEAAGAEYERRMDLMEEQISGEEHPATAPELVAFVNAALARFPELDETSGAECPWASSPLVEEAVGDLIYFPMTFPGAGFARDPLAEIAASLGLVCYDPQAEMLLPEPRREPRSSWVRRTFGPRG